MTNNENPRLEELSGLAESNRFKDVFYSIEDSQNENVVYVINKNGTLKGLNRSNQHWANPLFYIINPSSF